MKINLYLASVALIAALLSGCREKYFDVNTQILQNKVYEPSVLKYNKLKQSVVLYLDHSTCVIDAVNNSPVFKALRPNLGQYCDTLRLIKGNNFESIALNREDNKVSEVLETIKEDISFADIRKTMFQICSDNQQAILISDCESYANSRFLDMEPYMSEPFRDWLNKGHSIYIVIEPYKEYFKGLLYDKKRFYFFFTNDKMEAPISHNMLSEIEPFLKSDVCTLFKMTNSDIFVQFPKNDVVDDNLDIAPIEFYNGFEFISISDSWNVIREYVMKLDEYGEPLPEEEPVPLIKNLMINHGVNYSIEDIQIKATNITSRYLSLDSDAGINLKLDNNELIDDIDISDGFMLDKNAFINHKLNIMLTEKIFNDGYLSNVYGGNLIRLDFIIANIAFKHFDPSIFEWQSIWNTNQTSISVSKSIDNAIRDIKVVPKGRIIHTIFIKTEAYK